MSSLPAFDPQAFSARTLAIKEEITQSAIKRAVAQAAKPSTKDHEISRATLLADKALEEFSQRLKKEFPGDNAGYITLTVTSYARYFHFELQQKLEDVLKGLPNKE